MIDISVTGTELWRLFSERLASLGVTGCECISSDVCALVVNGAAPQFEVVHCSGVLYHHPNPIYFLEVLRRITSRHLILTSAVTQETISNSLGHSTSRRRAQSLCPRSTNARDVSSRSTGRRRRVPAFVTASRKQRAGTRASSVRGGGFPLPGRCSPWPNVPASGCLPPVQPGTAMLTRPCWKSPPDYGNRHRWRTRVHRLPLGSPHRLNARRGGSSTSAKCARR